MTWEPPEGWQQHWADWRVKERAKYPDHLEFCELFDPMENYPNCTCAVARATAAIEARNAALLSLGEALAARGAELDLRYSLLFGRPEHGLLLWNDVAVKTLEDFRAALAAWRALPKDT